MFKNLKTVFSMVNGGVGELENSDVEFYVIFPVFHMV